MFESVRGGGGAAVVGQPNMVDFAKASTGARTFAELEDVVRKGLGRIGLMMFMEHDQGAVLRKETGRDAPKMVRFLIGKSMFPTPALTPRSRSWWMSERMACICAPAQTHKL
jgi:hypothetical protein